MNVAPPILYAKGEARNTLGRGLLTSCLSCEVSETLNADEYELTVKYPMFEKISSEFEADGVIMAKAHPEGSRQPFRIYEVTSSIGDGILTAKATHDCLVWLHNTVSIPGEVSGSMQDVLNAITEGAIRYSSEWPYTFHISCSSEATISYTVPTSLYEIFYDDDGVLARFGAEISFDGYAIILSDNRGTDRKTCIRENSNMASLQKVVDASEVVTGVIPYYAYEDDDGDPTVVYADPMVIPVSDSNMAYDRLIAVDCSSDIEKPAWSADNWEPSRELIAEYGRLYIVENYQGIAPVSYAAGVVSDMSCVSGPIAIGDTVHIMLKTMETNIAAKVVGSTYNCLTDTYSSIDIGTVRTNLAQTIVDMTGTKRKVQKINMTIRNGSSGYFRWGFSKTLNKVDVALSMPKTLTCNHRSGNKYRSSAFNVTIPDDMEYMRSWNWDKSDTQFIGETDATVTISATQHLSGSSPYITIYAEADKNVQLSGHVYVHWSAVNAEVQEEHYVATKPWQHTSNVLAYSNTNKKNRIFYLPKNTACQCVGKYGTMYAVMYPISSIYRVGFCDVAGGASAVQSIENGRDWVRSSEVKLYANSNMKTKVGTIPANTTCKCLDVIGGVFVVAWQYETGVYKIGFTKYSGGVLDEIEEA